jgi:hypothetical protein
MIRSQIKIVFNPTQVIHIEYRSHGKGRVLIIALRIWDDPETFAGQDTVKLVGGNSKYFFLPGSGRITIRYDIVNIWCVQVWGKYIKVHTVMYNRSGSGNRQDDQPTGFDGRINY